MINLLPIRVLLLPILTFLLSSPLLADEADVVKINATTTAAETVDSLKLLIEQRGYKIYSVLDHGDKKSLKQVISFGKTSDHGRIMWHDPAAGLELPLKIAVFEDEMGEVKVIYRKPTSLRNNYSVGDCRLLDELDGVMADLAKTASQ